MALWDVKTGLLVDKCTLSEEYNTSSFTEENIIR